MASKKATSPAVETLTIEEGAPSRLRAPRGLYLESLKKLSPNSQTFFRVGTKQQQSVRQVAYKNGLGVHIETILDKNKKPTGEFKVFRTK